MSQTCLDIGNLPNHLKASFLVGSGCLSWETVSSSGPELELFSGESGVHTKNDEGHVYESVLKNIKTVRCVVGLEIRSSQSTSGNVDKPSPGSLSSCNRRDYSLPASSRVMLKLTIGSPVGSSRSCSGSRIPPNPWHQQLNAQQLPLCSFWVSTSSCFGIHLSQEVFLPGALASYVPALSFMNHVLS